MLKSVYKKPGKSFKKARKTSKKQKKMLEKFEKRRLQEEEEMWETFFGERNSRS